MNKSSYLHDLPSQQEQQAFAHLSGETGLEMVSSHPWRHRYRKDTDKKREKAEDNDERNYGVGRDLTGFDPDKLGDNRDSKDPKDKQTSTGKKPMGSKTND